MFFFICSDLFQKYTKTFQVTNLGALREGPGGSSGTGPEFFRRVQNFGNSARCIYPKMKILKNGLI